MDCFVSQPGPTPSEPSDEEVSATFAQLVAGLEVGTDELTQHRWNHPVHPSVQQLSTPAAEPEQPPGWRVHIPPDDPDDEKFTPPPPAPLPRNDLGFWTGVLGLTLGPIWLIYLALADPAGNRLWKWLAGAMIVAGFVALILRLPSQRTDPDDDGARV